jgi:hypothetical protein
VAIIGLTPAPALKEAVHGGDLTQSGAVGQIAARINHAAPELAYIQRFSARVLAGS